MEEFNEEDEDGVRIYMYPSPKGTLEIQLWDGELKECVLKKEQVRKLLRFIEVNFNV